MRSCKAIKVCLWVLWDSLSRFLEANDVWFKKRDTIEGKTQSFIKALENRFNHKNLMPTSLVMISSKVKHSS